MDLKVFCLNVLWSFKLSPKTFEALFKMLMCPESLWIASSNFICLVLSLQEVYKMHFIYICFGRHSQPYQTLPGPSMPFNCIQREFPSIGEVCLLIFANITFQSLGKFVSARCQDDDATEELVQLWLYPDREVVFLTPQIKFRQ